MNKAKPSLEEILLKVRELGEEIDSAPSSENLSGSFLQLVLDTIPVRVFWKDTDSRFLGCNQAFAKDAGLDSPQEMIGKTDHDMVWREQAELYRKDDREVMESGHERTNYEEPQTTPDGSIIWLQTSKAPIKDRDGTVIGVLGTYKDITEHKRLKTQESRAQRLESAGKIAGQIAHDFNNLLGPLMAYPEFIRARIEENHPALMYINRIEESAAQMADINQQLLTLARRGHFTTEALNLNDIVREAVNGFNFANNPTALKIELCDNLISIKGGKAQLLRALSNVLQNALDAVEEVEGNGEIDIITENVYLDDSTVQYCDIPKGEYARLRISDTGCGIPDNMIQKIFDPFFTSKQTDKIRGSGLGLSVVNSVLEDHSGYVDVASVVGEGTRFDLYFPTTRDEITLDESSEIVGGSESIMIIDDDDLQREVTRELLTSLGYQVTSASCGEQAIELVKSNPTDLLVLDMIMPPGIDGAETFELIRAIRPKQRAIIVSGFSETERVAKAQALGAGAFVKKPLTIKNIAVAVRTELEREPAKSVLLEQTATASIS